MTAAPCGGTRRTCGLEFPAVSIEVIRADLTGPLILPELDGIVAANSLHFVARDRQVEVVRALAAHLRIGGTFVVVEYDADRGNPWVPHPFSYPSWERIALAAGLADTRRIGRVPSRFLDADLCRGEPATVGATPAGRVRRATGSVSRPGQRT